MAGFSGSDRLEMLGYEILHLISAGYTEDVDGLIKEMQEGTAVKYLMQKYKKEFFAIVEGCPYNLDDWEKILQEFGYLERRHDVQRKMGLMNENDGLLMMLSIILETVSLRKN